VLPFPPAGSASLHPFRAVIFLPPFLSPAVFLSGPIPSLPFLFFRSARPDCFFLLVPSFGVSLLCPSASCVFSFYVYRSFRGVPSIFFFFLLSFLFFFFEEISCFPSDSGSFQPGPLLRLKKFSFFWFPFLPPSVPPRLRVIKPGDSSFLLPTPTSNMASYVPFSLARFLATLLKNHFPSFSFFYQLSVFIFIRHFSPSIPGVSVLEHQPSPLFPRFFAF